MRGEVDMNIYADIWECKFCEIGNDTPFCAKCGVHKCTAAKRGRKVD